MAESESVPSRLRGSQSGSGAGNDRYQLRVEDVVPVRGYIGYEDTGLRSLGLERLYAGMMYGNMFGRGGILSYQYTADSLFSRLEAHAVNYTQPLTVLELQRLWQLAGVSPTVGGGLNQNGESWQAGTSLVRHIVKNRYVDYSAALGLDFKTTNNNLEFGGQNVQASEADLLQLRLGLNYLKRGCCGEYRRFSGDVFIGPGDGFTGMNSAAAFNTIRANTDPSYIYARLRMERLWNIPRGWQLSGRLTGQLSSERLLLSETLGYGGYDSIRGYDQRTLMPTTAGLPSV